MRLHLRRTFAAHLVLAASGLTSCAQLPHAPADARLEGSVFIATWPFGQKAVDAAASNQRLPFAVGTPEGGELRHLSSVERG